MAEAALPASAVKGVGFDATCSLVVVDAAGHPLTVSSSGDPLRNVIVWMDHRAMAEARRVNEIKDDVLRYVGRFDLAGNGNSQAAMAKAAFAIELPVGRLFLRPRRLPSKLHHLALPPTIPSAVAPEA